MDTQVRRVENHTDALIFLPPMVGVERELESGEIDYVDFPKGVRLQPGLNTVPQFYLDALQARERPVYDAQGKPRKGRDDKEMVQYPGRDALAQLCQAVNYTTASGRKFGPRVVIHVDAIAERADGPAAPYSLPDKDEVALAIIGVCDDTAALKRWAGMYAKRLPLKVAIDSRLSNLRAGKAA